MDDSKTQLHEDTQQEIGLKKNLQTSQSDNVREEHLNQPSPEEGEGVIEDVNKINFSKDISEQGIPIENEVIEEQSENDEEERKTQTEHFKKMNTNANAINAKYDYQNL